MKVLLVGEFSSLHKFLKEGLNTLPGINAELIASGDGWKKIGGYDYPLFIDKHNKIINVKSCFDMIGSLDDYDVIQIINPNIYSDWYNTLLLKKLFRKGKIISLASAGGDLASVNAYLDKKFLYNMYDEDPSTVTAYKSKTLKSYLKNYNDKWVVDNCNVIIPSSYTYYMGYCDNNKTTKVIPFPINTDDIQYQNFSVKEKIVFFHGLNRESHKGTKYIRAALERIKQKYPSDVDVIIDGHMPLAKYMDVMKSTNVVLDQCCSYGYGINACIALAQGKIVLSGCREETKDALGVSTCPVIPIEPSVDQIYNQLLSILDKKSELTYLSQQSRLYVEAIHNYRNVATKYAEIWKRIIDIR